ncbi:hypothetical protein RIF29_19966 [Crotalaria pallida]|uniref:CS domain-containing protein n=1 Tax=Crotalaria pallida TaxID=3830 RepID=A0AAN9F0U0_CROPI
MPKADNIHVAVRWVPVPSTVRLAGAGFHLGSPFTVANRSNDGLARFPLMAVFVGHNHGLDWCCPYKKLWLCYARHTGYGGYGDWPRGARILEITQKPFSLRSWIRMEDGTVHSEIVNVNVPIPEGIKSRFATCEIKKNHLKVGLKGHPLIIELLFFGGDLYKPVKPDNYYWRIVYENYPWQFLFQIKYKRRNSQHLSYCFWRAT